MPKMLALLTLALALIQPPPGADALTAALRPALPFPAASADGDVPADNNTAPRWFVVWPSGDADARVVVRANPLNPEVQKEGAEAMERINAAVAAAERRAQAAYEDALEKARRTGQPTSLEGITLDDEGIEGDRIDAEMELVIEIQPAESFQLPGRQAPAVAPGPSGTAWVVSAGAEVYTVRENGKTRERFRPAQTRVYFGDVTQPAVGPQAPEPAATHVAITAGPNAFAVILRGNPELLAQVVARADWMALVTR